MRSYDSVNPATGETLAGYALHDPDTVDAVAHAADAAFRVWRREPFAVRGATLQRLADLLRREKNECARTMASEMGKPLADGLAEIEKCALLCEYYAEHGEEFLREQRIQSDATRSFVAFEPLGVVLAIMPWNFPFWQAFRAMIPALTAGNAMLLKHAPNVPGCALAIERIVQAAGFPPGLYANLFLDNDSAGDLIDHPVVRAVTLTGSTRAGRSVASRAGRALKPTVLELGGSDPYLIFADADIETAARICAQSRLINGGQSCIAAKRFIAVTSVYEQFLETMTRYMRAAVMGDPFDARTTLGPMARRDLRDALHRQVQTSVRQGASLQLGGVVPPGPGAFYPATVLAGVTPEMEAGHAELFGPVAAIMRADDEQDALRLANASPYGLGAAIFTTDIDRAEQLATTELAAGCCFINAFVKSDPRLPFGAIKDSGYGRELSGFGIREFVNIKTIYRA